MPADAAGGFLKGPPAPPRKANAAVDYLNTLYQPDDRLAIVAVGRHRPDPKVEQRVVTARAATRPGYQPFLRHLNATGHDIFVSMNPIRLKTQSREKADVLEVRRLQLQDGHRIRRKGNPMGRSRLRPITGDAPLAGLRIYLAPSRSASLPGSRRRQDQEPEAKFGRLARLRPIHGLKRRRDFVVRQRPEVLPDGRRGRQRALDSFPGHVVLDVAMRPAPPHGAPLLLEALNGRTIRDCERVGHSRR